MRVCRHPRLSGSSERDVRIQSSPLEQGHTLVELLIVMVLLAAAVVLPVISIVSHLNRVESRSSAIIWEAGAAAAQIHSLWAGSTGEVRATQTGLELIGSGVSPAYVPWGSAVGAPFANVSRWRQDDAVVVRFLPGFGSPDGGGSLYFGREGSGQRVVLRVESGLTRRTTW